MPSGTPAPKTMLLTLTNSTTGSLIYSGRVTQFSATHQEYTYTSQGIRQTVATIGLNARVEP